MTKSQCLEFFNDWEKFKELHIEGLFFVKWRVRSQMIIVGTIIIGD